VVVSLERHRAIVSDIPEKEERKKIFEGAFLLILGTGSFSIID
jgi:hypothetical protein